MAYYTDPINFSDPVWSKSDPDFNERLAYPYSDLLETPKECVQAIDWIIANIVDLYDDPIVEKHDEYRHWYDFIWGKTWSIRRKIIQMRLDDLEAVGIMERCARFHIFCSHAFVDFPVGYFVPKINFENIGKILVALRHLYSELNQRGIHCANEAEFMCYYLIYFPESYRDVSEFSDAVRNSNPLIFARNFLSALTTNNFIAFFELVKKGTYLQACLMHRYFLSFRTNAFHIMYKAYQPRSSPAKIPVNVINSFLLFEDDTECEDYCNCLGIEYKHPDVIFDDKTFKEIIRHKPILRRSQIIERLRQNRYLSDIITGGEGRLLSGAHIHEFAKLDLDLPESTSEEPVDELFIKTRVAEGIWKNLIMIVINNKVIEIFKKIKYPFGESDYEDQPSEASIVSELNGTLNESDAEIVFDAREDEATRIQEEKHLRGLLPKSLQDNLDKDSVTSRSESLETSICQQESSQEVGQTQLIEPTSVQTLESEETLKKPAPNLLKPRCLLKFVKPRRGINFGMVQIERIEESEISMSIQPECEPERSQELKSILPGNTSISEPEPASTPSREPESDHVAQSSEPYTSIYKEVAKESDDSDLIVSDDDIPKQIKSRPRKVMRATAASVLRAIARINEKRGT